MSSISLVFIRSDVFYEYFYTKNHFIKRSRFVGGFPQFSLQIVIFPYLDSSHTPIYIGTSNPMFYTWTTCKGSLGWGEGGGMDRGCPLRDCALFGTAGKCRSSEAVTDLQAVCDVVCYLLLCHLYLVGITESHLYLHEGKLQRVLCECVWVNENLFIENEESVFSLHWRK